MSLFIVNTGTAPSPARTIAEIEADITALLTAAPETDFAFLLKTSSGVYSFEKGTRVDRCIDGVNTKETECGACKKVRKAFMKQENKVNTDTNKEGAK